MEEYLHQFSCDLKEPLDSLCQTSWDSYSLVNSHISRVLASLVSVFLPLYYSYSPFWAMISGVCVYAGRTTYVLSWISGSWLSLGTSRYVASPPLNPVAPEWMMIFEIQIGLSGIGIAKLHQGGT